MTPMSKLNEPPRNSRVSKRATAAVSITQKQLDTEQSMGDKQRALRLFCRALIRLYLQDSEGSSHDKGLGVL